MMQAIPKNIGLSQSFNNWLQYFNSSLQYSYQASTLSCESCEECSHLNYFHITYSIDKILLLLIESTA